MTPIELMNEFINQSGLSFTNISSEMYREYVFGDRLLRIHNPLWLHVSDKGGHRVFDAQGTSYYITPTWYWVTWEAFPGKPNFVK